MICQYPAAISDCGRRVPMKNDRSNNRRGSFQGGNAESMHRSGYGRDDELRGGAPRGDYSSATFLIKNKRSFRELYHISD